MMRAAHGDPVFWIGCASCAGAVLPIAPGPTLFVLAALLVVMRQRRLMLGVVVLLFTVGAVRAHAAVRHHERERRAVIERGGWPARCTARGTVSGSPMLMGGGLRIEIETAEVSCRDETRFEAHVAVHVPAEGDAASIGRGDEVTVAASLAPPYRFWNDGAGDPRPMTARRGIVLSGGAEDILRRARRWTLGSLLDRVRVHARQRIEATFPPETSAMARALVLGEADLSESDQSAFRQSGLSHLLAVSGMHLVLVVMSLVAVVRALLVRLPALAGRADVMRVAAAVGIPIAWLYADVAGGSGSAIRAAWMCTITLLARAWQRRTNAWRALGLSMLLMSLLEPLVVFDLSFVLSALATTGLLAFSRPIESFLTERVRPFGRTIPVFVAKPFATTAAATIACAPILATMAPELPLGGLVANLLAVPLGELAALPLCLVHGLLASWPSAESGCATAASGALFLVRGVARSFTWGALPVPPPTTEQLAVMTVTALAMLTKRPKRWAMLGASALIILELTTRLKGSPSGVLRVTFLDVGQGDAAIVDLPDGTAMLIDGGGLVGSPIDVGDRVVATVLSARRKKELAIAVLSHPHPDHFLGLTAALRGRTVSTFWDTGQGEAEGTAGPYASLLAGLRQRGTKIANPNPLCGKREIGGAEIEVRAPCPGPNPDHGANDNSFVLSIRYKERSILFVGDAEQEEEKALIESDRTALQADVLKVGHHGSRTSSSPPFLEAVHPAIAVISCGVRNRFGHPHPTTLEALRRAGPTVYRTDRNGSVTVTTNGRTLDVSTASPEAN